MQSRDVPRDEETLLLFVELLDLLTVRQWRWMSVIFKHSRLGGVQTLDALISHTTALGEQPLFPPLCFQLHCSGVQEPFAFVAVILCATAMSWVLLAPKTIRLAGWWWGCCCLIRFRIRNSVGYKWVGPGDDRGCSCWSLLGVNDPPPPPMGLQTLSHFRFLAGTSLLLPSSTLAVSPVCPCAAQTHLVLKGCIPDGALGGVCWEISVRSQRWPRPLVVQGWMVWPVSGRQCGWRAGRRRRRWRYHGEASLDWSWIVDPQVRLWSGSHGGCRVWYHGRDRGSVGEVSCERLVRDSVHAVARVGLHCRPHVAIYWVVYFIYITRPRSRLCLHPAVHASFPGREGLVTVGTRQERWLVRRRRTKVVLLRGCRRCLQVRAFTSQLQVPGIICREDRIHNGCIRRRRACGRRTYLCVWSSGTGGRRGLCWGGNGSRSGPGSLSLPKGPRRRTDTGTGLEDEPWELLQPASLPDGCGRRWASGEPSSLRSVDILCYTS